MNIEHRARQLSYPRNVNKEESFWHTKPWMTEDMAIQLANEAADARAQEIVLTIHEAQKGRHYSYNDAHFDMNVRHGMEIAASIAKKTIPKNKTREEVLERALVDVLQSSLANTDIVKSKVKQALDFKENK